MNERIDLSNLLFGLLNSKYKNVEFLEKLSLEELYKIHSKLNKSRISHFYRKQHIREYASIGVGSFVVSVAETEGKIIQMHFYPFGEHNKSGDADIVNQTLFLAIADSPNMFNAVELLHENLGVNRILDSTNSTMARLAVRFGMDVRNHKVNPYTNVVSTNDIPGFLNRARAEFEETMPSLSQALNRRGVNEKDSRIAAIRHFLGK